MKKILLVDDHNIILTGLKFWLKQNSDWKTVETFTTGEEAIIFLQNLTAQELPDIVLFDVQLKDELSFPFIKEIRQQFPSLKIVIYSMFDSTGYILTAKDCGAQGYVSKSAPETKLLETLERIYNGEECFELIEPEKMTKIYQLFDLMTKQERKVFQMILMNFTNKQISENLQIKIHTVEKYISSIYEKIGVTFREEIWELYK
ncbi:MAG: response regulator transcription factor [Treponema sp.]|nr:response regulator transcription factor [Candidatus Treponema equifaecale]